jgi:hypothetical protein
VLIIGGGLDLERRAPSRLEGGLPFKLAEAVFGAPFKQTTPLPVFCIAFFDAF